MGFEKKASEIAKKALSFVEIEDIEARILALDYQKLCRTLENAPHLNVELSDRDKMEVKRRALANIVTAPISQHQNKDIILVDIWIEALHYVINNKVRKD